MEEHIVSGVLLIIGFLSIAAVSSIILKKLHFPYTIGLVIVGALFGYVAYQFDGLAMLRGVELSPGIILYIILPTLIFDAAFNIEPRILLKNMVPILLLAVFGLILSAGFIGGTLSLFTPLAIGGALLFGTLISATDPVAVIALFNEIGAPKRLVTLIDGESLFNDATAIVLFTIILSFVGGEAGTHSLSFFPMIGTFTIVLIGGLLIGAGVGFLGSCMLVIGKGSLIYQTTISLIMAYVSFIVADHFLHVSGVMSTLAAGIMLRFRSEVVIKRSNIENLEHFWDYFSFVANSFVFLLLGLTEQHIFQNNTSHKETLITTLIAIPLITIARAIGVYMLIPAYNRFVKKDERNMISFSYQTILFWGGLRGAVPVALVLAIPSSFPHRELIVGLTLGYILFTLLVQGTTIKKLMDLFGIEPDASLFHDKEVVTNEYPFPAPNLANLVVGKVVKVFEDEGFFIRNTSDSDKDEFFIKKGNQAVLLTLSGGTVSMTTEPAEVSYVNTVMYETLVDLNESVSSIQEVIKPEKLQKLVATPTSAEPLTFNIMKYIKEANIKTPLLGDTKSDLLYELLQVLSDSNTIADIDSAFSGVMEREASMSTGMGDGVAMPHARTDAVTNVTIVVGIKPEGMDFASLDKKPTHIFFLILSPKNDSGPHIQTLAAISKILSNPTTRQLLIDAESETKVFEIIKEAALL